MHFGHVETVWFLFAGFRWSCDMWLVMCVPEAQDGGVVGVVWPVPAGLLNKHF